MRWHFHKNIFKVQKKEVAFFSIVTLLLFTALIKVPCPVCGGTGGISSSGMSSVSVINLEYSISTEQISGCANYLSYITSVDITLLNSGTDEAFGCITLVLQDYRNGKAISAQNVLVDMPPNVQMEYSYNVTFLATIDSAETTNLVADTGGDNLCKACNGTGKVSLNSWPLAYLLKGSLTPTQGVERPWAPIPM